MATQDGGIGNRICEILTSRAKGVVSLTYLCLQTRLPPSEIRAAARKLKRLGCPLTYAGKGGYLLDRDAPFLDMDKLIRPLRSRPIRWTIKRVFYIDSTHTAVRALAEKGAGEGTTVLAEMQCKGMGRLGRSWSSPYGGIWLSFLLRPRKALPTQLLTTAASLAIMRAVSAVCKIESKLKWPNDVEIGGSKVAGVLGTAEYEGESLKSVTMGLGVNANIDLKLLPRSFRDEATSIKKEVGADVERETLIASTLNSFNSVYAKLESGEEEKIVDEARRNSNTIGRRIRVRMGSRSLEGVAEDLREDGSLILKLNDGRTIPLYSDEVTLLS